MKRQTLLMMENRIEAIIGSRGKAIDKYESQYVTVQEVKEFLSQLGYEPISRAQLIDGVDKYFVYLINGKKYVLKKELDGVIFYPRGY